MRPGKRLLASGGVQAALAFAAALYIRFVFRTNRWVWHGTEHAERLIETGSGFLVCFWHGRLLLMPCARAWAVPASMLVSGHRDGRLIARTLARFGIGSIAGSSSSGGAGAARRCLAALATGTLVGVTPDGPRGPRCRAAPGVIEIARHGGAPILPVAYSVSRRRTLRSWDGFLLPLPFGRGAIVFGEPLAPPTGGGAADLEAARVELEARLDAVSAAADRLTARRRSGSMIGAYRRLSGLAAPALRLYLAARAHRGKEDPARLGERLGRPSRARPEGKLLWLHAASVGEAASALALLRRLAQARPEAALLLTTGTLASARFIAGRLPEGALHQYLPLDCTAWVRRFLDHWRPDLAIWIESELWPNLIVETRARGVPTALVNGRLSERSFRRWRRAPGLAAELLGGFAVVLGQDPAQTERLAALGAFAATCAGNLKFAAEPLPADPAALADLRRAVAGRPSWLAASTHPGEEEIVAAAHARLAASWPGLLTVIAPRHPARGGAIHRLLVDRGLSVARRSRGEPIGPATEIYLADTVGELGLFYRIAGVAFLGGSLVGHGGHNPLEPARLGTAVLSGPQTFNFAPIYARLLAAGAARAVADAPTLAAAVGELLPDPG
ncbi:MAG: glycosyltransferase N-terminal domain-containing protein, partial [Dongiaceae bacterium]